MELPPIAGTLLERLGLEMVEASPGRVVARMPVAGNTQPFGYLHGGATAALCETVASIGAFLAAGTDRAAFGIELSVNHLRSVREGWVTAIAEPIHDGSTTAVWDVRVEDASGSCIAVSRVTLAIREHR